MSAFYEQELAKLERKVTILAAAAGIVFTEETDIDLAAHQSVLDSLQTAPVVDRTPQPNTISPALPNVVIPPSPDATPAQPTLPQPNSAPVNPVDAPAYTSFTDGDFAGNGDPYGISAGYTSQSPLYEAPIDATVTPNDGVPNELATPVPAADDKE